MFSLALYSPHHGVRSNVSALSLASDSHRVNQNARKRYLPFFCSLSQKPRFEIIALKSMICDTFYQVTYYKLLGIQKAFVNNVSRKLISWLMKVTARQFSHSLLTLAMPRRRCVP